MLHQADLVLLLGDAADPYDLTEFEKTVFDREHTNAQTELVLLHITDLSPLE